MSLKVCAHHGCPELSEQRWCPEHQPKRPKDRRPSAWRRGYDTHWQRTRLAYLRAHPTCEWEGCTAPAEEVDHRDGQGPHGPAGHDWDNLGALCKPHHSHKTAMVDGSFGRPRQPR